MNIEQLRTQFPNLHHQINQHSLIYFDNAATTQLPSVVIDAMTNYLRTQHANVHRASHYLSSGATQCFEQARKTLQTFINARYCEEIIWTKGTTDSLNLISQIIGPSLLSAGDTIVVTGYEHHANLIPWQQLAQRHACQLLVIPIEEDGNLNLSYLKAHITSRCRLFAINHVSNVTGTIQPVDEIIALARTYSACIVLDGAQAAAHIPLDMQALDCDFYALSGHKMYGPTGIGILYGKREWLERLPPCQFGGEMVTQVSYQTASFASAPYKFEAGTPNILGAIGLAAAVHFIWQIHQEIDILQHEASCAEYLTAQLAQFPELNLLPSGNQSIGVRSFSFKGIASHDLAFLLDQQGIAVRCGQHCAMPFHQQHQLPASLRVSLAMYNTPSEIDRFIHALDKALTLLADE